MLRLKLIESNVDDSFHVLVPIYLQLADGRVVRLGSAHIHGNNTLEQTVPLTGLKETPRRVLINYNYDVLATGY
jgi:hypothetical protein